MEDIIKDLRANATDTHFPLNLPSEDDIIEVEELLCLPLPDDYKSFLLEVSDLIVGYLEPATVADDSLHTYLPDMASRAWDKGIPRELVPFCEDSDGMYCITMENKVVIISFEGDNEEPDEWSSIWEWAEFVWLANAIK